MSIYNDLLKDIVDNNKEYRISVSIGRSESNGNHDFINYIYTNRPNFHICTIVAIIESLRMHGKADTINFSMTHVTKHGCKQCCGYANVSLSDFMTFEELKKFIFECKLVGITQGGFFTETEEQYKNKAENSYYKRDRVAGALQPLDVYKNEYN